MALTLTKQLTLYWPTPPEASPEWTFAKEQYLSECVGRGITDGVWSGDWTTSSRRFIDQASAEEFLARWLEIHAEHGYAPLSYSITDV